MKVFEKHGALFVIERCKGPPSDEDTMEPLERVYEDVPQMLLKLLRRKITPYDIRDKASVALGL